MTPRIIIELTIKMLCLKGNIKICSSVLRICPCCMRWWPKYFGFWQCVNLWQFLCDVWKALVSIPVSNWCYRQPCDAQRQYFLLSEAHNLFGLGNVTIILGLWASSISVSIYPFYKYHWRALCSLFFTCLTPTFIYFERFRLTCLLVRTQAYMPVGIAFAQLCQK